MVVILGKELLIIMVLSKTQMFIYLVMKSTISIYNLVPNHIDNLNIISFAQDPFEIRRHTAGSIKFKQTIGLFLRSGVKYDHERIYEKHSHRSRRRSNHERSTSM